MIWWYEITRLKINSNLYKITQFPIFYVFYFLEVSILNQNKAELNITVYNLNQQGCANFRFAEPNASDWIKPQAELTIAVARIFDWDEPKPQITGNDVIRNFQKRSFCGAKIP